MKTSLLGGCTAVALFLCGCSLRHTHSSASKPSAASATGPATSTQSARATQPARTARQATAEEQVTAAEPSTETTPPTEAETATEADAAAEPAARPEPGIETEPTAADEPATVAGSATALQPAATPQRQATPPPKIAAERKATPNPKAHTETLTGKVVLVKAGYRIKLMDDGSGTLFRMTRGKRSREFLAEQINLRKYYEKTIVVRGKREDDWIWSAEVVGQWNKPGESRGPNLLAPPAPNR
jgi:hypothetical protein